MVWRLLTALQNRIRGSVLKKLLTYLLWAGLAVSLAALVQHLRGYPFPGNQEGYAPAQPVAYSHKLHAGDLGINCLYCHYSAAKGPHAGIPPVSLCMNCHKSELVTASWKDTLAEKEKAQQENRAPRLIISPELQKLYDALGLTTSVDVALHVSSALGTGATPWLPHKIVPLDSLSLPPAAKPTKPINWVRVHNLPDYTRFDHRAHVSAGVKCQECHGPVETMDVMRQSASLSMGWCVRCHKEHKEIAGKKVTASTDCAACHY
jgi:hypothetical protein